ncbi:MAG: Transcription elongation factor SPT5, partial [Paramarteilia canceri]
ALQIKSVICRPNLPGCLYIESADQGSVRKAISGITALKNSMARDLITVPLREMPSVLRIVKSSDLELKEDDWVRIRRGVYKDDLARVIYVDHAQNKAQLKMVPRVNIANPVVSDVEKRKSRPQQKLFDKGSI